MTGSNIDSRRTPIDLGYGSCESTQSELLIYSAANLASITNVLALAPDQMQEKGARYRNARGAERLANTTYWMLSSEGKIHSRDIRHHLDWLMDQIEPYAASLRRLQNMPEITMGVNCIWRTAVGGGPTLWPEQMRRLAGLNLECGFDIYFIED